MKQTRLSLLKSVLPLLRVLSCTISWKERNALLKAVHQYESFFCKIVTHRGLQHACDVAKLIKNEAKLRLLTRFDLKHARKEYYDIMFLRLTKRGFPCALSRVQYVLRSKNEAVRRFGMTILESYRTVSTPAYPSYSSRVTDTKPRFTVSEIDWACAALKRRFKSCSRIRIPCLNMLPRDSWSSSAGPYGGPAPLMSSIDAQVFLSPKYSFYRSNCKSFVDSLRDLTTDKQKELFPSWGDWVSWIERFSKGASPPKRPLGPDLILSRLVFITEGGGKTRGVTPINYFVQAVLKPFHDFVMEILRRIPMDCSFSEEEGLRALYAWTKDPSVEPSGFDCKDFTDYLSRDICGEVLRNFTSSDVAKYWKRLMAIPVYMGLTYGERPFAVGAPMGIYGLWPVAALTHHVGCQISARRAGLVSSSAYIWYFLRGDDVLSRHRAFMEAHMKLMEQDWKVPVSLHKCIGFLHGPQCAEFAKRTVQYGRTISTFPIRRIVASRREEPLLSLEIVEDLLSSIGRTSIQHSRHLTPRLVCTILHGSISNHVDSFRGSVLKVRELPDHSVQFGLGTITPSIYSRRLLNSLDLPFNREAKGSWSWLHGFKVIDSVHRYTEILSGLLDLDLYPKLVDRLIIKAPAILGADTYNLVLDGLADSINRNRTQRYVKPSYSKVLGPVLKDQSLGPSLPIEHPMSLIFLRIASELNRHSHKSLLMGQDAVGLSKAMRSLREIEGLSESLRSTGRYITRLREMLRYHKEFVRIMELIRTGHADVVTPSAWARMGF